MGNLFYISASPGAKGMLILLMYVRVSVWDTVWLGTGVITRVH